MNDFSAAIKALEELAEMQNREPTLSKEQVEEFMNLACALSPENLYCDGEISHSAATKKYKALRKQWQALEIKAGRKVSEDEVWAAHAYFAKRS